MGYGYDEYCCDRCARDAAVAQKRAKAGLDPMPDIVGGDLNEVLRLREVIERFDLMETLARLRAENERLRGLLQAACVLLEQMEEAIAIYLTVLPKEQVNTRLAVDNWAEVSQRIRQEFRELK